MNNVNVIDTNVGSKMSKEMKAIARATIHEIRKMDVGASFTARDIAKSARKNRRKVFNIMARLQNRGFISRSESAKTKTGSGRKEIVFNLVKAI